MQLEAHSMHMFIVPVMTTLAEAKLEGNDPEGARRVAEHAIGVARRLGNPVTLGGALRVHGRADQALGRLSQRATIATRRCARSRAVRRTSTWRERESAGSLSAQGVDRARSCFLAQHSQACGRHRARIVRRQRQSRDRVVFLGAAEILQIGAEARARDSPWLSRSLWHCEHA